MEKAEIKFSMKYLKTASRREYGDVQYAWIREVLQNSLDARSKNIGISVSNNVITVIDDGCGMSYETLTEAFLTLGGSKKEDNDVGGFGKAKEIELFTWDEWSIITSTGKEAWLVTDKHINEKPIDSIKPNFKGTIIRIKSDEKFDDESWCTTIQRFINTCTTKCNIYLDNKLIDTISMRGKKITTDWAEITYNKKHNTGDIYVRIGGITMFETWHHNLTGTVLIDLTLPSTEILTSSREAFRMEYRHQYNKLIEQITIDTKSAFKSKPNRVLVNYAGSDIMDELQKFIDEMSPTFTSEEIEIMSKIVEESEDVVDVEKKLENITNYNVATGLNRALNIANSRMEQQSVMGFNFAVLKPEKQKLLLDPNSKKAQNILNMTKNITLRLMSEIGITTPIHVGLIYPTKNTKDTDYDEEDNIAKLLTKNGKQYVLINPYNVDSMVDLSLGFEIFLSVSHELAHLKYTYHDESFTCLWNDYMRHYSKDVRGWNMLFKQSKQEVKEVFAKL